MIALATAHPRNANALAHLRLANLLRGDVEGLVRAAERLAALDTTRTTQLVTRWIKAVTSEDTARAVALYDSLETQVQPAFIFMDAPVLMVGSWQAEPIAELLERLHDELIPGSSSAAWYHVLYYAFQDLGRPRQADQMLAEHERARGEVSHRMRVLDAIYGAMPEEVGAVSAAAIEGWLAERSEDESSSAGAVAARTTLELWRVAHDDLSRVDDAAALYRSFQPAQPEAYRKTLEAQALLLEAMARLRQGEDTLARATIERMDEIVLQGPPGIRVDLYDAMVLATADVYERLGDPEKALLVLERESNFDNSRWPYGATFARERGRLAGLTGDTVRAIREYEFYVRMRASAEPALEPEVEDVRAALTELRGG